MPEDAFGLRQNRNLNDQHGPNGSGATGPIVATHVAL
jgi:hypothetical protein